MRKAADLAATDQIYVAAQPKSTRTNVCNARIIKHLYSAVFSGLRAEVAAATVLQQILA
jgi:hypothetical protein